MAVNTHGRIMKGLKEAAGATKQLKGFYSEIYIQITYIFSESRIEWTYQVSRGHNSWTRYDDDAVYFFAYSPMTMQEIADILNDRMIKYVIEKSEG